MTTSAAAATNTLPKQVTIGYQVIQIVLLDHYIASNVGDQQGSYEPGPPPIIYLDKSIMDKGGLYAVNLLMHELNHHIEYANSLEDSEEELRVTAYANMWTEILARSELRDWLFTQLDVTLCKCPD